ncbi:hypothetical protein ACLB2K_014382 [Fragaria x ananassa]
MLVITNGIYILVSPNCKETWTGFSWKAFHGIWPYFKLTIASAIMLCLEIWYSQGLVLISGLLSDPTISLDSISICMNYLNWDMQFMLGLAAAASVRVSNELGAGHPKVAKFSVFVVNGTSILISIVFSAIVLIFKVGLSKLFTSDTEVIEAVSNLTPLLAISVFLNGIQPILSGVAIGSGWQAIVAYVNLSCYYIIGLPIACVLGFKTSMGVAGIWWGMVIGVFLQTVTLIVLTARTNWDAEVENAAERLRTSANVERLLLAEDDRTNDVANFDYLRRPAYFFNKLQLESEDFRFVMSNCDSRGVVKSKRSIWRLKTITDFFWAIVNLIGVFFATMFSMEKSDAYRKGSGASKKKDGGGPGGPGGGPYGGGPRGPPRGLDNVRGIDHSSLPACGSCCG